tara:strand:- start:273 stop:494 length:222 start_codon:yes stop_codon:yes gene_type:complete
MRMISFEDVREIAIEVIGEHNLDEDEIDTDCGVASLTTQEAREAMDSAARIAEEDGLDAYDAMKAEMLRIITL